MTQTTFTDNVLIDGSQDIEQLRVQGHSTQTEQLQTWEDSSGDVLAQVTGDGRLIVGDDVTPDSLIEAHRLDTSTNKPKRGIHSLGQITGTLNALVQWIVGELELTGASAISVLHTALRIRASNKSTTAASSGAELRGADIEVINDALANTAALPKATGLQVGVTNASGKTITDAIGLKVKMDNSGTMTNPFSIYTEGAGPLHLEDYMEVKRPASVPGTPATDFVRIYPQSNGRLYAKNWNGTEYDLTSGGSGGGVDSVNSQTGDVVLDTDDIDEGATNKYYTDARFDSRLATKDTDDLVEGSTNLYYTSSRFDADLATKDTDDVSEGTTNKYYTDTRFDTRLATKDTDDLAEGSNLYYTNARFDSRLATKNSDELTEGTTNLYYTNSRVDGRIAAQKGSANGLATLGSDSKVPASQLPAIAVTDVFVVSSQAAMLALTAERGDVAVRTDINKSFILTNETPGTLSNWQEILAPGLSTVLSVNSQTGSVVLTTANISENTNLYYTDSRFDTRLATKNTDNLTEGSTNKYYTDERVDDRVANLIVPDASLAASYDDAGGVLNLYASAPWFCARLTPTTGVAIPTSDATAVTQVFLTPFDGNLIAAYDGTRSRNYVLSADISIKLTDTQTGTTTSGQKQITGLTNTSQFVIGMKISGTGIAANSVISTIDSLTQITMNNNASSNGTNSITFKCPANTLYDIFVYPSDGNLKLEMVSWSSLTARATSLVQPNGYLTKNGDATRRFVGCVLTTSIDGQTEKSHGVNNAGSASAASGGKCYIVNYYNRLDWAINFFDLSSHAWTSSAYRNWNANANAFVGFVSCMADYDVSGFVQGYFTMVGAGTAGCELTLNGVQAIIIDPFYFISWPSTGSATFIGGGSKTLTPRLGFNVGNAFEYGAGSVTQQQGHYGYLVKA